MDREVAHYRRHPVEPGVDVLNARYVTHRYARHTHATYTVGLIEYGVEEFQNAGTTLRAAAGQVVLVNPDTPHTGQAGVPEGWRYHALYPSIELMREIAAEIGGPRGTPCFPDGVVDDPVAARLLRAANRGAERADALASSSLLRLALAGLLRRQTRRDAAGGPDRPGAAAPRAVRAARDILHAGLAAPPSLPRLAAAVGMGPYALLRAFRATYGLPPHAYLIDLRVRRARTLLDHGMRPAEVAAAVGFADQSHLTRHFKRAVGVPPGAYLLGRTA